RRGRTSRPIDDAAGGIAVMNAKRILLGGLLAALVITMAEALLWAVLLPEPLATAYAEQGLTEATWTPALMLGTTLVNGLMLAWLSAAIRPRFGRGPRTAMAAGAFLWVATWLMYYLWLAPTGRGLLALRPRHTAVALAGELAGVLLAALAAASVYREADSTAAPRPARTQPVASTEA